MDKEVEAIGIVLEILQSFDYEERKRIVNYAGQWVSDNRNKIAPEKKEEKLVGAST